ncbi:MAG TPA: RluA family pseudouridine synthase [Lacipirellulaceae bacterium]|nr:RluA family pseudouridine synthase [Lacipirellulaceae bacterium]
MSSHLSSWPQRLTVAPEQAGLRLDVFLAQQFPAFSRAFVRRAIDAGHVRVDGTACKPSLRLREGSLVVVDQIEVPREGPAPQEIPLSILYEDDAIVVVDKPAGMIVHPAKGHWEGTLASALAHHFGPLSSRGGPTRPGIVHRLDRDTTGVIVVAKNDRAHDALAAQFKSRTVEKEYLAIVVGMLDRDRDVVDEPIGPHPTQREKKAIRRSHPDARPAVTVYEVVERFDGFALVRARPKTGRTHQIRIHLAHIGCPVLCDRLYGGRAKITELELIPKGKIGQDISTMDMETDHPILERQALHAHRLAFLHPTTGERMQFEAPLPPDIENTLAALRRWRSI